MSGELLKREVAITSFGAASGTVTGSCHVLESGRNKVVVDFGIFQGKADSAEMKRRKAREQDVLSKISQDNPPILITHSHIDHVGFLPVYFHRGFESTIFATKETMEIMEVNLGRSAQMQVSYPSKDGFFFESADVKNILDHTVVVKPFEEIPVTRDKKITATFCPNGHTVDSSSILVSDKLSGRNVLFTGDIGRPDQLITGGYNRFSPRYPKDPIDVLVTESTCYPGTPMTFNQRISLFQEEIEGAFRRGNTVLMPCIQHRYMENVEIINNSQKKGGFFDGVAFFRDGPSLADITSIYKKLDPEIFTTRYGNDPNYYKKEEGFDSRFRLSNLGIIYDYRDSAPLLKRQEIKREKTIIFASGGMGEDGRTVEYLRRGFTTDKRRTIAFSCFQVEGTIGANLFKKQENSNYKGATIVRLEGGSSHATGADEIFGYHRRYNLIDLEKIIITHGSNDSRKLMAEGLRETEYGEYADIKLPEIGERVDLS